MAWAAVRRGSTRTASWAEWINVDVVGDQTGAVLFGSGMGGTARSGGARKTFALRGERDIVEKMRNVVLWDALYAKRKR